MCACALSQLQLLSHAWSLVTRVHNQLRSTHEGRHFAMVPILFVVRVAHPPLIQHCGQSSGHSASYAFFWRVYASPLPCLSSHQAGATVDPVDAPSNLSLCRLLVAVTDVLDVPKAFLEEAVLQSRSLQLRYDLLGRRHVVPVDNPVAKTGTSSAVVDVAPDRSQEQGGGGGGGEGHCSPTGGTVLVHVPVKYFRCE